MSIRTKDILRKAAKYFLYLLCLPVAYILIGLLLTYIPVNTDFKNIPGKDTNFIFLNTNGVHLDIIIPKNQMDTILRRNLFIKPDENYVSFGWGDKNFYLNTPTWGDLTVKNAFQAMLLKSATLIHVTRYKQTRNDWKKIYVSPEQFKKINHYIFQSFELTVDGNKQILPGKGYGHFDDFYKARGNYSCLHTCNGWVNDAFKESGLKACLWTPFDFGLMNKY